MRRKTLMIGAGVITVALLALVIVASSQALPASATISSWGEGEDGDLTIDSSITYNIHLDNHPGRACADGGDAVEYTVDGLTNTTATLTTPPQPGCLSPGDEIMLIKAQGNNTSNVGVYEFLQVDSVSGNVVTFTMPKTYYYGNSAGSDDGINDTEHVILQRVPHYGTLAIFGTLTGQTWDGNTGGFVVFRAQTVTGSGNIDVTGLGYRGGQGGLVYYDKGQQGESIGGEGTRSTTANLGGAGGGLDGGGGSACSTCAHLYGAGGNYAGGATGGGFGDGKAGEEYGSVSLSQLYLGSGGGGGGNNEGTQRGGDGGAGGGAILAYAETWNFSGNLIADGTPGTRGESTSRPNHGGPGSGGSIHLIGDTVFVGNLYARGVQGASIYVGGDGRIAIEYTTSLDFSVAEPSPYTVALPTPTPTPTFTPSPTATPTFTPSPTPTPTFTPSPTATPTFTPSPTATAVAGTPTPTQAFWATATAQTATPQTSSNGYYDGQSSSTGSGSEAAAATSAPTEYTPYVPPAPYGYFTVVVRVFADANRDNVMSLQESVSGVPVYAFDAMFHRIGAVLTHKGIATFQVPVMPGQMYYFDLPYLGLTAFVNSPRDATQTQPLFVDFRLDAPTQPVMLP